MVPGGAAGEGLHTSNHSEVAGGVSDDTITNAITTASEHAVVITFEIGSRSRCCCRLRQGACGGRPPRRTDVCSGTAYPRGALVIIALFPRTGISKLSFALLYNNTNEEEILRRNSNQCKFTPVPPLAHIASVPCTL